MIIVPAHTTATTLQCGSPVPSPDACLAITHTLEVHVQPGVNMLVHPRLQDAADEQDEWVLLAARLPDSKGSLCLLKNKANGEFCVCRHIDGQRGFDGDESEILVYPADRLNAALHGWNDMVAQYNIPASHRWSRLDNNMAPPGWDSV